MRSDSADGIRVGVLGGMCASPRDGGFGVTTLACPCTEAIAAARRSPVGATCRVCGAVTVRNSASLAKSTLPMSISGQE